MPINIEADQYFFRDGQLVTNSTSTDSLTNPLPASVNKRKLAERARVVKTQAHDLLSKVMAEYKQMKPDASIKELAYANHFDHHEPPTCKTCGAQTKFTRLNGQMDWANYCNSSCQMKDPAQRINADGIRRGGRKKSTAPTAKQTRNTIVNQINELLTTKEFDKARALLENITAPTIYEKVKARITRVENIDETTTNAYKNQVRHQRVVDFLDHRINLLTSAGWEIISMGDITRVAQMKHDCGYVMDNPRLRGDNVPTCPNCQAPAKETAQWNFLRQFGDSYVSHRLHNGQELDAHFEKRSLAIEYNGFYWHSSAPMPGNRPKRIHPHYHQNKMLQAQEEGIELFMVWEDEAQDPEFGRTLDYLFDLDKQIDGDSCTLKSVSIKTAQSILGEIPLETAYGLFDGSTLVSVAGINDGIIHFKNVLGFTVTDALFLFVEIFLESNKKISAYVPADRGWGIDYLVAGGRLVGLTEPDYFYFNQRSKTINSRVNKQFLTKENFYETTGVEWDDSLSEEQNAATAKFWQVHDCGKWVFEWSK